MRTCIIRLQRPLEYPRPAELQEEISALGRQSKLKMVGATSSSSGDARSCYDQNTEPIRQQLLAAAHNMIGMLFDIGSCERQRLEAKDYLRACLFRVKGSSHVLPGM